MAVILNLSKIIPVLVSETAWPPVAREIIIPKSEWQMKINIVCPRSDFI